MCPSMESAATAGYRGAAWGGGGGEGAIKQGQPEPSLN